MKSGIFIILIPFITLQVYSQALTDTMYFNLSWEQTTKENARYYRVINMNVSGDFLFLVTDYYLSGQVQMTGIYRSIRPDNREGKFVWYFQNGQKQQECEYKANLLHGLFQEWYENGQIKTKQSFYEGILDGSMKSWREDGTIRLDAQYSKGEKHGYFMSFYDNGQMTRKDLYDFGRLIEGQCYTPEGNPTDYFPYIEMPSYKGGIPELRKFINKELKYPKKAEKEQREATILVIFTVDTTGQVQNPQILQGAEDYFNEEALRLINSFPLWTPGKIDNNPSPLQITIPIDFRFR